MPVNIVTRPDRPLSKTQAAIRAWVRFYRLCVVRLKLGKKFSVGSDSFIGASGTLQCPEYFRIGNRVGIGPQFFLQTNLVIGDDTLISANVSCVGNDHAFDDPAHTVFTNGRLAPSTVIIEGDSLIGYGVTLVGNVRIGKGCIVGARAVVTRDLPPYTVCAGVPARPIRPRYPHQPGAGSTS